MLSNILATLVGKFVALTISKYPPNLVTLHTSLIISRTGGR